MIVHMRPRHAAALVLLAGLLAGCGGTAPPSSAPAAPSAAASPTVTPEPTTTAPPPPTTAPHGPGGTGAPGDGRGGSGRGDTGGGGSGHTESRPGPPLLWPVTDPSAVAPLQARVDDGAQPWLLDPAEVAVNFAGATYGWRAPQTGPVNGNTVVVTDAQGGRASVTLTQPGRTGPTGIWVVTAAQRS